MIMVMKVCESIRWCFTLVQILMQIGDGPMIWLDGLDLPLYQAFPTNFAEMYQEERYPSE